MRRINYRHYICIVITLGLLAVAIFLFPNAWVRMKESATDLWTSTVYYFEELFFLPHIREITVKNLSQLPLDLPNYIPNTWQDFKVKFVEFWKLFVSKDNVIGFGMSTVGVLYGILQVVIIALPFVLVGWIVIRVLSRRVNNNYNVDTKPLKVWKWLCRKIYAPTKRWVKEFCAFVQSHRWYWIVWLCITAYCFNIIVIAVETIAFYLYFVSTFDVGNVFVQVVKLLRDLSVLFKIPLVVWLIVALIVVDRVRRRIGYNNLDRMERRIRGFLNEREFITLWCGTIGKGKTTCITSAGISWEIMFRDKALELLLETDMKFPYFPWINLENEIKRCMDRHSIYNLASCRRFARSKHLKFNRRPMRYRMFGYDYERYGTTFNDNLKVTDIWQAIEDYTQLYFIYIIQSSLILSNYSVRTDNIKLDEGNLPLWDTELFRRDARYMQAVSRHSHILDFDSLRLGKKVITENKYANSFEFGVLLVTEIGKERGNMLENKGKKKTDEEANQLNDLFNAQLKMLRHAATVCNYCFVRLIADEQRPESWGADAKELADIIYIKDKSETRLAMPLFGVEEAVIDWVFGRFIRRYTTYRYRHGNNTLLMYWYKSIAKALFRHKLRIYNTFGYKKVNVQVYSGQDATEKADKTYYILFKKDYSLRFATDAYSEFWASKALRSDYGMDDLPVYGDTKATMNEFAEQNSYFMIDLFRGLLNNFDEEDS